MSERVRLTSMLCCSGRTGSSGSILLRVRHVWGHGEYPGVRLLFRLVHLHLSFCTLLVNHVTTVVLDFSARYFITYALWVLH